MNTGNFALSPVCMALIAGCGTWFVTALGAATVFFFRESGRKILNIMLGFAAGVMIAASFWSLLEPAIDRAERMLSVPAWLVASAGFTCGAAFIWLSEKAVEAARRSLGTAGQGGMKRTSMLVLSVTLHNIPEGLAVGVAFGALGSGDAGPEALVSAISVALGIALQNYPEGAAVALPMMREGCPRARAFFAGQASGLVEPAAALIGALTVARTEILLPYALAFAAGAMILVAVHELIPGCRENTEGSPYLPTMGIIAGFALMMLLDTAL